MRTNGDVLTAHHEAGHIVAAIITGGTITSVSIEPDGDDHLGWVTGAGGNPMFFAYAGPWAEGRCEYGMRPGVWMDDCISAALYRNIGDRNKYGGGWTPYKPWSLELEAHWPLIQEIAEMLLDGDTDVAAIADVVRTALAA